MDNLEYVGIDAAIDEYIDLVDLNNMRLSKTLLRKWAQDVVEKLTFKPQQVHKVSLQPIENGRVILDDNLFSVVQVLYRETPKEHTRRGYVSEWVQDLTNGCDLKLNIDCPECVAENGIEVDYDYWVSWNHPQLYYDKYVKSFGGLQNFQRPTREWRNDFRIMRYKQHNFFNADQQVKGNTNFNQMLGSDQQAEYWVDFPVMYTDINDGWVLISYTAYRADENGYRLIPNLPQIFEAIKWKIESNVSYREYKRTRDRSYLQDKQIADVEYNKFMGQARERLKMPSLSEIHALTENILGRYHSNDAFNDLGAWKEDIYNSAMKNYTRK